jgi:hypothetical protein
MTTYRIVRFFRDSQPKALVRSGVTLAEAQAHCNDPETSSVTCLKADNVARTKTYGPWFDGYETEE